jgi:hypothetical protein
MYQNGVNVSASSWTAWKLESGRKWKLWNALNALNSERSEVIVILILKLDMPGGGRAKVFTFQKPQR